MNVNTNTKGLQKSLEKVLKEILETHTTAIFIAPPEELDAAIEVYRSDVSLRRYLNILGMGLLLGLGKTLLEIEEQTIEEKSRILNLKCDEIVSEHVLPRPSLNFALFALTNVLGWKNCTIGDDEEKWDDGI